MKKIKIYTLPENLVPKGTPLVLGCDPGTANFGIGLVGAVNSKPVIYASSMLMHPMNNMMSYNTDREQFLSEIDRWVEQGVKAIAVERFQTRGLLGTTVEVVSTMIGALGEYRIPVKAVIASQWKVAFARRFGEDLKDLYKSVLVLPHQLDAVLIGIYGLEMALRTQLKWTPDKVFREIEKTSLIGTRRTK